jgi:uncharacterized protein (TIGR02996 family)
MQLIDDGAGDTDDVTNEPPTLDTAALDPVERQFLSALASGDDACGVIYADWLEDRGDLARAEFLRAQAILARAGAGVRARTAAAQQLELLAPDIDLAWRLAIRRPGIAQCAAFGFRCERAWSALTPTRQALLRQCDACERRVRCCRTGADMRRYSRRGTCVVLDEDATAAPTDSHGLPEQLRYLEQLSPVEAPPVAMRPIERSADLIDYLRDMLRKL